MPPRNPELPEGTDHIINGAMETNGDAGVGGAGSGFIGSGDSATTGDDTGGTAAAAAPPVRQQLREGAQSLKDQAETKVRSFAKDGKSRATTMLDDLSKVVGEAADSIDQRLGAEFGGYARRAADSVSGLADSLRRKEVDDLYEDVRGVVRKSPALAIGAAAAVGFALVRLIKSGVPEARQNVDVEFTPDTASPRTGSDTDA